MNLAPAQALAQKILAQLAPHCHKIEIAGSIRRQRPEVNDIDLVILPKPGELKAIKARCLKNCHPVTDGDQNFIVRFPATAAGQLANFQIDIFIARSAERDLVATEPGNWGSLLLCRTGSKEHNIWLVQRAESLGLRWHPYRGVYGPPCWPEVRESARAICLASETEEDIYHLLQLDFIPPEHREPGHLHHYRRPAAAPLQ
jgi:DNA polymerase/3'-5' exonuclease PolX